ncbi:MAG: SAM-dependent methyltransferase [Desulfovibrio sp.]|nr:SAM-dependent methyltransferase [Desulfovibrio sp.]
MPAVPKPCSPLPPNLPGDLSPGPLLAMSGAYWRSCALHAGVLLDVFTPLAETPATPEDLAPRLGCEPRALGMLLRALCAMGLLVRQAAGQAAGQGGAYAPTDLARAFLVRSSPRYVGHIIRHHHQLVDSFGRMDESVRSGRANRSGVGDGPTAREDFLLGMFNIAMGIAPRLAGQLDALLVSAGLPGLPKSGGRSRLLDLGGGPGTYAIQFCLAHPGLTAAIFDLPATRPFAEATVARFGVGDRVDFLPGDYTTDPVPGGFDLAWLSQILHAEGPDMAASVVRRAAQALNPGGLLLVHEFLLDDAQDDAQDDEQDGGQDGPEFAALFSLNMLLGTAGGQSYAEGEVRAMLEQAGLTRVCRLGFAGPNDSGIIVGMKGGLRAGAQG